MESTGDRARARHEDEVRIDGAGDEHDTPSTDGVDAPSRPGDSRPERVARTAGGAAWA